MTEFLRLWGYGYARPVAFVNGLAAKRGYRWGLAGQALRAMLDSLLVYLPVALLGRVPPTAPVLPVPPERYYFFLVLAAPPILITEMLLGSVAGHGVLRALGRRSDLGFIVNLSGMTALVVGAVIVVWDWSWFALGYYDQYFLGITHLLLSIWSVYLSCVGLKRHLDVPVPLGILLSIVGVVAALMLAVPLMRSPF